MKADRLEKFLEERSFETYPEPQTAGHAGIIDMVIQRLASDFLPVGWIKVLDVGCGADLVASRKFAEIGYSVTAITVNREEFNFLSLHDVPSSIEICLMDQNDIDKDAATFDAVFARHVLEHSIAPFWTLAEFHRVLKPGGVLYAEMPAPDTTSNHEGNRNHYSVMGHSMWKSLIWRAGFEVIESQEFKFNTPCGPDEYFNFFCKRIP